MSERERRSESPFGMPGGLSQSKLIAFSEIAERFGWHSFEDEGLIRTIIPKIKIIRKDLEHDIRTYDKVVDGVMTFPSVISGYLPKTHLDEQMIQQLQRGGLLYEVNKIKIRRGQKIPWIRVSIFQSGVDDIFIRLGTKTPPQLAPIPLSIHRAVAFIFARKPKEIDPDFLKKNLEHIAAAVRAVNTIAGTNRAIPESLTG